MARIRQFEEVRKWAEERGLYTFGDPKTQTIKMMEELGEFSDALLKQDINEMKDALGDMQVVLINLAKICGFKLEDCLGIAYLEILSREGKMVDGTFQKDESIGKSYDRNQLDFTCSECGLDLGQTMGYVCPNDKCPSQTKVIS